MSYVYFFGFAREVFFRDLDKCILVCCLGRCSFLKLKKIKLLIDIWCNWPFFGVGRVRSLTTCYVSPTGDITISKTGENQVINIQFTA